MAATPPRRGAAGGGWNHAGPPPPYPYDYENVSPGTPYNARGGAGTAGMPPPPHSPYGSYRAPDYWGEPPTPTRQGYWGPPHPSTPGAPYQESFRMGPPSMRGGHGMHAYPHYRSPMRRAGPPYVSPGEPLSPGAGHYKDFRPPAPASARKPEEKAAAKQDESSGDAEDKDKKKGDALSVLADVSAGIDDKDKEKGEDGAATAEDAAEGEEDKDKKEAATSSRPPVPVPAPTSPLQRRSKPSPITPSQTPQVGKNRSGGASVASAQPTTPGKHQPITPSRSQDSASTNAGAPGSSWEAPSIPPGVSSEASYPPHSPHRQGPYTPVRSHARPPYGGDFAPPHPTDPPALVERGSFDSHGADSAYRNPPYPPATPPSRAGFFYDDGPPPGYGSGNGGSYWEAAGPSPYSPSYRPPPRGAPGAWNQPPPPPPAPGSHHDPYYPHPPPGEYGPPPAHYGEEDPAMGHSPYGPPPSHHYRGPPMPPPHHYPGMHGPPPPYGYMQHPRMEEKTILRKKFSWKHYPELERFLISNRDEYLKHSNMNYTAEQKQYNNWLTERLLEVAGQNNYMFDPDDFNFVAIRDRIRCYYKSYVQTARKRGLKLPEKKK